MDLVNIILAAYNGEKFIKEQIDSIINNTFSNWIIWIFDDGSTDNTSQVIAKYKNIYQEKIQYTKNSINKGHALNFLEGALCAKQNHGDIYGRIISMNPELAQYQKTKNIYYMFCDQDDVWMPDKIEKTLKHMKMLEGKYSKDHVLAVFTDAVVVDENLNKIHSSFYEAGKLNTKNIDLAHIMMENKMIGCTVLFNEALMNKMHTLPQNARYHDWWIALISATFGLISFLPEPTLYYRQHNNNVVGNQNYLSYILNRVKSLKKQKAILNKTIKQGKEFYNIYEKEMSNNCKMQVYAFANLLDFSYIARRKIMIRHGFLKTGWIRNIGLMLIA